MKKSKTIIDRFSALGDKTRFKLLSILSKNKDYCVSELADEVGISTAGVSQQLKVLEQAGLLKRKRDGQKICYEIASDDSVNQELLKIINKGEK